MTDKLRKYVLPNIPYVFIGWAFLKLGTAYRLAAGSDFAHKAVISPINSSGWVRLSAQPLPTLPPAWLPLTGWWALWERWRSAC